MLNKRSLQADIEKVLNDQVPDKDVEKLKEIEIINTKYLNLLDEINKVAREWIDENVVD